jgi:hypothetical protein
VITEYLRLARRYVSGGNRLLDLLPGAMSGKTNHGIPNAGAGSAGLAGGVRSARRGSAPPMPRQGATCRGRVRRRSARPSHPPPWRAPSGASAGRSPRRGRSVGSEPIRTMPQSGSRRQAVVAPLARFNEAQIGRPEDYRHRGLPDTLGLAVWKGEDHGTSRHRHVHGGRVPTPSYSPQRALSANPQTTFHTCTGPPNPSLDFSWPRFSPGLACRARPKCERSVGNER